MLLLAARYGYTGANGLSPTEDEYNHAVKIGKPVLAFVQDGVEREPGQAAFVARVRGSWEQGASTATFTSPAQLTLAVVKALTELRHSLSGGAAMPVAIERVRLLAGAQGARGFNSRRVVRVAFVPIGAGIVLDAFALGDWLGRVGAVTPPFTCALVPVAAARSPRSRAPHWPPTGGPEAYPGER